MFANKSLISAVLYRSAYKEIVCCHGMADDTAATAIFVNVDHFLPSGLILQTCPEWKFFKSDL